MLTSQGTQSQREGQASEIWVKFQAAWAQSLSSQWRRCLSWTLLTALDHPVYSESVHLLVFQQLPQRASVSSSCTDSSKGQSEI